MTAGQYQLLAALTTVFGVLAALGVVFFLAVLIGRGIDARDRQVPRAALSFPPTDPQEPRS